MSSLFRLRQCLQKWKFILKLVYHIYRIYLISPLKTRHRESINWLREIVQTSSLILSWLFHLRLCVLRWPTKSRTITLTFTTKGPTWTTMKIINKQFLFKIFLLKISGTLTPIIGRFIFYHFVSMNLFSLSCFPSDVPNTLLDPLDSGSELRKPISELELIRWIKKIRRQERIPNTDPLTITKEHRVLRSLRIYIYIYFYWKTLRSSCMHRIEYPFVYQTFHVKQVPWHKAICKVTIDLVVTTYGRHTRTIRHTTPP